MTFGNLGSAAAGLLDDKARLAAAVGGLSLLALGIYSGALHRAACPCCAEGVGG